MTILPKSKKIPERYSKDRPCPSNGNNVDRDRQWHSQNRKPKKQHLVEKSSPGPASKRAYRQSQSPVNSDDECGAGTSNQEREQQFVTLLEARGLQIKEMNGDGSCLFRAVADQVYGDQEMHTEVRRLCMDYMERNPDHFSQFVTEDFKDYINRKRRPTVHGNHIEVQAMSEMYARPIEIFEYSDQPINIFHPSDNGETNAPIRLSYHQSAHYNSVVDPYHATIGVGLGLPGLVPGAADNALITEAMMQSDALQIEEAMLNDKMHMTDWQRTEEDIKEKAMHDSYMDYVKAMEHRKRGLGQGPSTSRGSCSPKSFKDVPSCSHRVSPVKEEAPSTSKNAGLYEELLAMQAYSNWDGVAGGDPLIEQALLLSTQQYIDDFKHRDQPGSSQQ